MSDAIPPQVELRRLIHLTRPIGEGGMARVVDGFAPDLGQYVAVKILRAEYAADAELRARFQEEAALQARIDHPGCPPIYGQGEDEDGLPCYAMKKVEGRTLADLLADRGHATRNAPWRKRLLLVLLDVCETIGYAHEVGVVHRDLKPENILIDKHSSVYVIDWGIAKSLGTGDDSESSRTLPGKVMGSPGYLSPEQADGRGASAGPQADVFALGTILYEVLTGSRPFGGAGGREEMLAAVHCDPKPPKHGNPRLPRSISDICMKALSKDPALRYCDARALASDLRAFLEGRLSLIEEVRTFARLHPLGAIAAAVVALVVVIAAGNLATQFWTDHRMANRAVERVTQLDAELADIAAQAEDVRGQLKDPGTRKRAELTQQLKQLDARWVMTEFEAMRLLVSVAELRFEWVEEEIRPLARKRLFVLLDSLIARGQATLAGGLIETLLQRHASRTSALDFSKDDIARLKQFAAEAQRRSVVTEE